MRQITVAPLTLLNLSGNRKIKRLPEEIGRLRSLRVLYLPADGLIELPESIGDLKALQIFNVEQNPGLRRLPSRLSECQNLTTVILHGNRIEELPDLSGLKRLKHLSIGRNPLKKFPAWLKRCLGLERLCILPSGRPFDREIYDVASKLPGLTKLVAKLPKEMEVALKRERKITIRPSVRGWASDW